MVTQSEVGAMSSWQSFLLAWAAAQSVPAVAADPTPENVIYTAVFLASLAAAFAGINAVIAGCRALFQQASGIPRRLRTEP